jgi:hypothetical protein
MDKRVGIVVAAILLLAAGFGAGWFVRGSCETASAERHSDKQPGKEDRNKQPGKEDKREFWHYPKGVREATALQKDSSIDIATFTTPDDIATVAAWYSERLVSGLPDLGTVPVIPVAEHGMAGGFSTETGVNVGGGSVSRRGVKVVFGARTSPASAVTVLLSRADAEDRTYIVISFSQP